MTPKKREVQHILLQEFELMISGIILAGGLSTRLGRDKSLEPIENQTVSRHREVDSRAREDNTR